MANEFARKLRRNRTASERALWQRLRVLKAAGFKFRQQVPIENYIVDFACLSQRMIVEIDGATHSTVEEQRRDVVRQTFLEAQGFRVLRFWNDEVMSNIDGVMDRIVVEIGAGTVLKSTPTPAPSPQGGGERRSASGTVREDE